MVNKCCVVGCPSRWNWDDKSYYSIPAVIRHQGEATEQLSEKRRLLWLVRLNRMNFVPSKHARICSDHFQSGKPSLLYDSNNPDWAPSLSMGYEKTHVGIVGYVRGTERKKKKGKLHAADAMMTLSCTLPRSTEEEKNETPCQFYSMGTLEESSDDLTVEDTDDRESQTAKLVSDELNRWTCENQDLRRPICESEISSGFFEGNDEKVKFFTGLSSYVLLMTVLSFLEDYIRESSTSGLTKFQKLVLVLMKLRLNMPVQHLANTFKVSKATVSQTFLAVIHVMYMRLKDLVLWPDRKVLRKTMPMEFRKHFGLKVAVIIDCFEISIERPSSVLARAGTSSDKHRNTVKFLIGIAPQGVISFLSDACDGRASDKFITDHSGLLDKLLPGDLVLADRGFDVQGSVGLMCAEVKTPAFTKGKTQLSPLDVESTRKIARVRIYVKRVIGHARNKYAILQGTLPVGYLTSEGVSPVVDKIVTVCCALTNLCESIVPFD